MQSLVTEKAQQKSGLFAIRNFFLDLLFPPVCAHCGRVDWHFCADCLSRVQAEAILLNPSHLPPFAGLIATAPHQGLMRDAILALKYEQGLVLAPLFAERMASALKNISWTFDIVVPVPISSHRLQERGYNQAKEISYHLAQQLNIPHQPEALSKSRHTQSQVGLSPSERHANVQGAFSADSSLIRGKTLLLVDDVRTTGATLTECAQTAINFGAVAVYGITVTAAI